MSYSKSSRPSDRAADLRGAVRAAPFVVGALVLLAACDGGEAPVCPSLGAGTRHASSTIETDQTWSAEGSPHFVDAPLAVVDGATLTIEPCAVVRLAPGASIEVGLPDAAETGRLVARGTEERAIRFERSGSEPWGALVVHAPSTVELAHVVLEGGGGDALVGGATVVGVGQGTTPAAEVLRVDEVQIRGSAGHGVVLDRAARFASGSRGLTITESGDDERPEPLVVGLHGLEGLPDGQYTGNARDAIVVLEDGANTRPGLQVDTTLRDLGVPYRVGRAVGDDLRVGANGGSPATLRIEAGVVVRFHPEGSLRVVSDDDAPRGTLVVAGTRERPVVLTSLEETDGPGAWAGVYFEAPVEGPMAAHDVAFARVERAGGHCSCSLTSCSPVTTSNGAVIFDGRPREAFVRDTVIVDSAGHGFVRSWLDHADIDFLTSNTVERVGECAQTAPELSERVCPSEELACD